LISNIKSGGDIGHIMEHVSHIIIIMTCRTLWNNSSQFTLCTLLIINI